MSAVSSDVGGNDAIEGNGGGIGGRARRGLGIGGGKLLPERAGSLRRVLMESVARRLEKMRPRLLGLRGDNRQRAIAHLQRSESVRRISPALALQRIERGLCHRRIWRRHVQLVGGGVAHVIMPGEKIPKREAGGNVRAGERISVPSGLENADVDQFGCTEPTEGPFFDGDFGAVEAGVETIKNIGAPLVVGNPDRQQKKDRQQQNEKTGSDQQRLDG